jgi:metal-responsive CopG/Arc/MetJ family transcriptional regulator
MIDTTPVKRTRNKPKINRQRLMISLQPGLIKLLDEAAKKDFTTRSGVVRTALLWYLKPHEFAHADPDEVLKTLKRRQDLAALRRELADNRDQDY